MAIIPSAVTESTMVKGFDQASSVGLFAALAAFGALVQGASLQGQAPAPRVLIIYDMEGISGVVTPSYERYGAAEYPAGREALTADVNAAIRGLKAGGAGAIWVQDGHGSGNNQDPDILVDKMDKGGSFDFRSYRYDPYYTGIDGSVDAIICIGMHARARSNGFIAHTSTFDVAWRVNGVDLTETHIVALSAARFGIPVIMVSGDNVLKGQLATDFPQLEYAEVKHATSLTAAVEVPRAEADQRIEKAARAALESFRAGRFRPYYLPAPYDFRLSFRTAEQGRMAAATRGVAPDGDLGVRFEGATFIDGYLVSKDVIAHAMNPLPLLLRVLKHQGDSSAVKQMIDLIWLQVDPADIPAWALPPAPGAPQKRFYGDE